jgi:hypothetical protein
MATDEQILAMIGNPTVEGGRAFRIAERLGLPLDRKSLAALHRRLRRLQDAGKIKRHPRYSYINSIYWIIA